jgi:heme iron utilization protein
MIQGPHHDPVHRLNDHHADDLLATARAFGGHPDAISARAKRIDRAGIALVVDTPRGRHQTRVDFTEPVADAKPGALRRAFRELAGRAQAALATDDRTSSTS